MGIYLFYVATSKNIIMFAYSSPSTSRTSGKKKYLMMTACLMPVTASAAAPLSSFPGKEPRITPYLGIGAFPAASISNRESSISEGKGMNQCETQNFILEAWNRFYYFRLDSGIDGLVMFAALKNYNYLCEMYQSSMHWMHTVYRYYANTTNNTNNSNDRVHMQL